MRSLNKEPKKKPQLEFVPLMSNLFKILNLSDSNERKEKGQAKMSEFVTKKVKYMYSNSDPRQLQLTDALLKFIAGNLLPLSIVESEKFKNIMEIADSKYQMPSESICPLKCFMKNQQRSETT